MGMGTPKGGGLYAQPLIYPTNLPDGPTQEPRTRSYLRIRAREEFVCPDCDVLPGMACRNEAGNQLLLPHDSRYVLAVLKHGDPIDA